MGLMNKTFPKFLFHVIHNTFKFHIPPKGYSVLTFHLVHDFNHFPTLHPLHNPILNFHISHTPRMP
jgi:hypothetical protein